MHRPYEEESYVVDDRDTTLLPLLRACPKLKILIIKGVARHPNALLPIRYDLDFLDLRGMHPNLSILQVPYPARSLDQAMEFVQRLRHPKLEMVFVDHPFSSEDDPIDDVPGPQELAARGLLQESSTVVSYQREGLFNHCAEDLWVSGA